MSVFERVKEWNEKCGKGVLPIGSTMYYEDLLNQCDRVQEELNEVVEAITNRDLQNLTKEGVDLDVVVSGLNFKIGSDYLNASCQVLDNNDLKYTVDRETAYQWYDFWISKGEPVDLFATKVDDYTYYCIKRTTDDKVMKSPNLPKVKLGMFAPEPSLEVYVLLKDPATPSKQLLSYAKANPDVPLITMEAFNGDEIAEEIFGGVLAKAPEIVVTMQNGRVIKMESIVEGGE